MASPGPSIRQQQVGASRAAIDAVRGKQSRAEFAREAIAKEIGRRLTSKLRARKK